MTTVSASTTFAPPSRPSQLPGAGHSPGRVALCVIVLASAFAATMQATVLDDFSTDTSASYSRVAAYATPSDYARAGEVFSPSGSAHGATYFMRNTGHVLTPAGGNSFSLEVISVPGDGSSVGIAITTSLAVGGPGTNLTIQRHGETWQLNTAGVNSAIGAGFSLANGSARILVTRQTADPTKFDYVVSGGGAPDTTGTLSIPESAGQDVYFGMCHFISTAGASGLTQSDTLAFPGETNPPPPPPTPVAATWLGGNGIWADGTKWSTGVAPNGPSAVVVIDNAPGTNSVVSVDNGFNGGHGPTVGRLQIDAGDQLDLPLNSRLRSDTSAGFEGAGEWHIDGVLTALTATWGVLDGPKTITGTGKIVLGSGTDRPEIYGVTTNNATIEGGASFGRSNNSSFWDPIYNSGVIDANLPGSGMFFHTFPEPTFSTNTGTMKATNGSLLQISQGAWDGTGGTMLADGAGSIVQFGAGHFADMKGGHFTTVNGGLLRIGSSRWTDLTMSGAAEVTGLLTLRGTVTNNGTITIPEGGGRLGMDTTVVNGVMPPVTLAGSGEVVIDRVSDYAFGENGTANKLIIQDQTVRGRGAIGRWSSFGMEIENHGTILADREGQTLTTDISKLDNRDGGILRATGGGILNLNVRDTIKNTGGTIEAIANGRIQANGLTRVEGGLVRNDGGYISLHNMVMVNPDADQTLTFPTGGMTLRGQLDLTNGQTMRLVNTIRNEGELRIKSTGSDTIMRIGENGAPWATLTGGGTITLGDLGDPANSHLNSGLWEGDNGFTLTNKDNLIHGFGQLGEAYYRRMQLVNEGTISADASGKQLLVHTNSLDNTQGDLRAESGGILNIISNTPLLNVGSLIEARANSKVHFGWFTEISGGTLRNSSSNSVFDLGHATLTNPGSGITLEGPFEINTNNPARLVGEITNKGTINILDSSTYTRLLIGRNGEPNVTLTGGGEIVLKDGSLNEDEGRLHQGVDNAVLTLQDQTLRGYGLVGYTHGGYRSLSIVNNSSIIANDNAKTLQLSLVGLTNKPGKFITAADGSTLVLDANQITNTGATILADRGSDVVFGGDGNHRRINGGLVESVAMTESSAGGSLVLEEGVRAEGGVVFNNHGFAYMGHPSAGRSFNGLENGGGQFINTGTIRKRHGTEYWISAPLTHTGTINTEAGTLRLFGGGTITNGKFNTSANSWTGPTNTSAPYTFSGANNVMDGAGIFFNDNSPIVLADAATQINATNFRLYGPATITGPGTMTFSGQLGFNNYSNPTISGAKLVNLPGAWGFAQTYGKISFVNGAQFDNFGEFDITGGNVIEGAAGSVFKNSVGGTLRSAQNNEMRMSFVNSGNLEVLSNWFWMTRGATFANSTSSLAAPGELWATDITVGFQGNNVVSGDGTMFQQRSTFAFDAGAKLDVSKLNIDGTSAITGGEVNVTKRIQMLGYGFNTTISGTPVRLAENSTGLLEFHGGTLRLNNGAVLQNGGQLDISGSPTFEGDGTGKWHIAETGKTTFHTIATVPYPLEVDGGLEVIAASGRTITFTKGGVLNDMAKLYPQLGARFSLAGDEWIARGHHIEFSGTGSVQLNNTTLKLEDLDANDPDNNTSIYAGAAVEFLGANTVTGAGILSSTQFFFQQGNTTVDGTTLATSNGGFLSEWNNPGGKLELKNGARFENSGHFIIKAKVGQLLNDPGVKGDPGTLFHNKENGRLIHDVNETTEFGIDFHNDGVLDFRRGTFKFLNKYTGTGGIAASNGAQVQLSLDTNDPDKLPGLLQTIGGGSHIDISFPNLPADRVLRIDVNGGGIVAAGAGNIVAAGAGNIVAAGGGNIVAAGGLNMVAAGAGNIIAKDLASFIQANKLVGMDGASLIGMDGASLAANSADLMRSASAVAQGIGSKMDFAGLVGLDAASAIAKDAGQFKGGEIISHNGGQILSQNGGQMIAEGKLELNSGSLAKSDGANSLIQANSMVAAGAGNLVAAGAGNVLSHNGGAQAMRDHVVSTAVTAGDPGTIVAEVGGTISGDGTFTGIGAIKNGGRLAPGMSPGTMTWNGDLTIENGGVLDIEIGGTVAGTHYDVVNVSGTFTMNGLPQITFVNGFGANVQSTDVFDIVTSGSSIVTSITGSRVAVAGTNATFAAQLVNGGTTLRLTDYQFSAPTFNSWAARYGLSGADATWNADPNGNGLPNLLEYALGLDPTAFGGSRGTTTGIVNVDGQKYLSLSYTKPTGQDAPSDITYTPERATTLAPADWSSSSVDLITHSTTPGPGTLETVTVRSTHPLGEAPREFMHLKVTLSDQ